VAQIGGEAFDFRMRIRFESARTRAHGHVIVGQADGVAAAAVRHANRDALVSFPVARRRRRTIRVGKTLHRAATFRSGRITGVQSRRALTLSSVVVGHANRLRSAPDRLTDGHASAHSSAIHFASIRFRTLGVRLAFVFGRGTAAVAIVGVAAKSGPTEALTDVVGSPAVAVGWTGESGTDGGALAHAQQVGFAGEIVAAVAVRLAVRQRRFLADTSRWVAYVAAVAVALRSAIANEADLVLTASSFPARIHTAADSVDIGTAHGVTGTLVVGAALIDGAFGLAAALKVRWVAMETILADARSPVVFSHTQSVGTALVPGTGVDALAPAVSFSVGVHVQADLSHVTI